MNLSLCSGVETMNLSLCFGGRNNEPVTLLFRSVGIRPGGLNDEPVTLFWLVHDRLSVGLAD